MHSTRAALKAGCLTDFSEGRAPRGPNPLTKNHFFWGLAELGLPKRRLGHRSLSRLRLVSLSFLLTLLAGCSLFSRPKPESGANDAILQAEVSNALNSDPALGGQQITVQSREGVIELKGPVKSAAVKSRAGLVAASVPGVVQVHNDLLPP
jgi:hypothetical protein